jgi:hypothetical protein
MAKVGQIITIPTGSYCKITLDSGETIIINHEAGGRGASTGARLTVDRLKLMGFSSDTVVQLDLDTAGGKAALADLTMVALAGAPMPPLRAFVAYIQDCGSVAEVVARCNELLRGR